MAEFKNPVILYSVGKDSSVLLHLAQKAFAPKKIPFPVLHIDTTWKFKEMILFREETAKRYDLDLRVYTNQAGLEQGISPFTSSVYTDVMKTEALVQALVHGQFDAAVGGARRDEEKSRSKEKIFSFRNKAHHWDPKNQRPEFWNIYNTKLNLGESVRVFPLSNWTELDVWQYIDREKIPIVPLYFAAIRPVVKRDLLIMVDDDRFVFKNKTEKAEKLKIRFRTLGCYPLTGAVESEADSVPKIIKELTQSKFSERQGRLIDRESTSLELKKQSGYF